MIETVPELMCFIFSNSSLGFVAGATGILAGRGDL